ncbi:MAG: transketolase [Limnochordia bacterium]|jgi:transketolase|nr:transketolase [Bacillota bacterium]NLH30689.1 transketolase [Bacillota bacterium]HOB08509.1 transketolase [Limnochordia bacterium]HPT93064.1 transketolase [Limnochordia bacterium]HXK96791.1 transketolase [Limnochordia bacterium]
MLSQTVKELEKTARQIRRDIITMIYQAGDGHPGPSLSCADLVTALYFAVMNVEPADPHWPRRDRLILSKGHACPAVYAALARKGYFDAAELPRLRSLGSILQGHPDMLKTPGIDFSSGSLGNGISAGLGMALAARISGLDYHTYVICGDGELQEGIVWEAAMAAKRYQVGNLTVLVDYNGVQSGGRIEEISGLEPLVPKWEAFGWHCQEIDGHDFTEILTAIAEAKAVPDRPSVIAARTVKGKGVSFIENNNAWHKRVPTREEWEQAMKELGAED